MIARLFNVIGERETNPHVVPEIVEQLQQGTTHLRLGNVHTKRDYTDVVDVAEALERLLLLRRTEDKLVVNVGSGKGVSVAELASSCERILGREVALTIDPARVRTQDRAELVADTRLLRAITGWAPKRTLEQTLTTLLDSVQPALHPAPPERDDA